MTTPIAGPQSIEILRLIIDNLLMVAGTVVWSVFMLLIGLVLFKNIRKLDLTKLFTSESTGEVSSTKFWSNIAYFVATVCFLALNFVVPGVASIEIIWLIYLGVVASSSVASKVIATRAKKAKEEGAA